MSSLRQVQQGRTYQLPPRAQGIAPALSEPCSSWQDNITRAAALAAAPHQQPAHNNSHGGSAGGGTAAGHSSSRPALVRGAKPQTLLSGATRAYLGVSPALIEELCLSAGVSPAAEPSSLSPETWQVLYAAWQDWLTKLQDKSFAPCSCSSSRRFSVLGSYPQPCSSVHELLDGYYFSLQAGEVYAALYQRLAAAVKGALKKARGRVRSFEQQLESAGDAGAIQKQGDIIVANLYRLVQSVLVCLPAKQHGVCSLYRYMGCASASASLCLVCVISLQLRALWCHLAPHHTHSTLHLMRRSKMSAQLEQSVCCLMHPHT